jgi:hypothetical protein
MRHRLQALTRFWVASLCGFCKQSSGGAKESSPGRQGLGPSCATMPSAVGATRCAGLQPASMRFSSQSRRHKHVPRKAHEQKTRHRMDSLNRRRVVPANLKLSAEISPNALLVNRLNMNQSDASLRWVTIIAWQLSNASTSYDCSQKGKSERTVCITANGRAGVPSRENQ